MDRAELECISCSAFFSHPGGALVMCPRCGSQIVPLRHANAERFVLDTNVYDAIVAADAVTATADACNSGRIELLMTQVQHDELLGIPDREKRITIASVPFVLTPTYGLILGTSKLGLARLGESNRIEAIRNNSDRHSKDALLATTAEYEAATLVTDDRRLTSFARRASIDTWSSARFIEHVAGNSAAPR